MTTEETRSPGTDESASDLPKFEHLHITMELSIKPEMNPKLGLPEAVKTRRGITVCGRSMPPRPTTIDELADLMQFELKGGLRAMKHFLQKEGYVRDER